MQGSQSKEALPNTVEVGGDLASIVSSDAHLRHRCSPIALLWVRSTVDERKGNARANQALADGAKGVDNLTYLRAIPRQMPLNPTNLPSQFANFASC